MIEKIERVDVRGPDPSLYMLLLPVEIVVPAATFA
jgi:hypothetical protein